MQTPGFRIGAALRNLFRKDRMERRLDDELRTYVERVTDEKLAAGMSPSEARRTALAEFGCIEPVKEAVREQRAGAVLERLWLDVRYGSRRLWRNPGLTLT